MANSLTIYPRTGDKELNIQSGTAINCIKIMDLRGEIVYNAKHKPARHNTVDITQLPKATYIVEVSLDGKKTKRSLFVKEQ